MKTLLNCWETPTLSRGQSAAKNYQYEFNKLVIKVQRLSRSREYTQVSGSGSGLILIRCDIVFSL